MVRTTRLERLTKGLRLKVEYRGGWVKGTLPSVNIVNTKNWYRKETDLWAEFGKRTPFDRKFSSKHSVKMPAVERAPSFGRRVVLRLEKEAFGNT
jgi:hypothetical protein